MPDIESLAPAQQALDTFIRETYRTQGYPLTIRQIKDGLGISSTSVVAYRVDRLVAAGRVKRERGRLRTIRPVEVRHEHA